MLPAEQPRSQPDDGSGAIGARLSAVPSPDATDADAPPFEDGLVRSAVVGGAIGFAIVFAMVVVGLLFIDMELAYVLPSAVFVAAFGGIGFGAMQAAALHKPRTR